MAAAQQGKLDMAAGGNVSQYSTACSAAASDQVTYRIGH